MSKKPDKKEAAAPAKEPPAKEAPKKEEAKPAAKPVAAAGAAKPEKKAKKEEKGIHAIYIQKRNSPPEKPKEEEAKQ